MKEKFFVRMVTQIISYGLSVISSYLVALYFEVELLGILAFSKSLIGLFSVLVPLSFASIYYQHNKDDNFEEYFTIFFIYKSILALANYVPLYFTIFLLEEEIRMVFVILISSNLLVQFTEIFMTHLISKMKILKSYLPSFIFSSVHSFLRIIIAFNVNTVENPLIALTLLNLLFSGIGLTIALIASRKEYAFKKFNKKLMKQYLKDSRPLIIGNVFSVIVSNLGNVLLSVSYGYETLAYYNLVSTNIISFLLIISGSIKTLSLSLYSSLFSENKNKEVERTAKRLEKYFSVIFLFIIALVLLNSELAFKLFLPNYLPSVIYMYILIFVPYFASINRPYSTQLVPGKKQNISAIFASIKIMIKITLIVIIVPISLFSVPLLGFGGIGLAIIESCFWFGDFFFYRYFSKKYFKIGYYRRIYLQIILAAISFLIAFVLKTFIFTIIISNDYLLLFITSGVLVLIFLFLLIITKEIKREDTKFFLSLFRIKSYKDSFLDEIRSDD